jgi:DNA invertase Pin-like site-specific DNA recombinase
MLVGYARISTGEQNLDLQRDALTKAGCDKLFTDEMSGTKAERPGLTQALAFVRKGDTLVVWRLDRLGRSLRDLLAHVEDLRLRAIDFKSLHESIDTTTPAGKLQFHIFSALAEFERDLIHERTMAGLRAARARGRKGGRKQQMTSDKLKAAASLMKDKTNTVKDICHTLGVSRATLYRYVTPSGEVRAKAA